MSTLNSEPEVRGVESARVRRGLGVRERRAPMQDMGRVNMIYSPQTSYTQNRFRVGVGEVTYEDLS